MVPLNGPKGRGAQHGPGSTASLVETVDRAVEHLMATALGLHHQRERRVLIDANVLDRIHQKDMSHGVEPSASGVGLVFASSAGASGVGSGAPEPTPEAPAEDAKTKPTPEAEGSTP